MERAPTNPSDSAIEFLTMVIIIQVAIPKIIKLFAKSFLLDKDGENFIYTYLAK